MNKLKNCPFCGKKVEMKKIPLWNDRRIGYYNCYKYEVRCENCGCTINVKNNDTIYRDDEIAKENVIKAWNKRTKCDIPNKANKIKPKIGNWILLENYSAKCSRCKTISKNVWDSNHIDKYCRNCGAEMKCEEL